MKRTKELLTDTFWELLEEKAYSKITVNDIVSRCDVNRNTFYYHFQDIPSLMINSIEKWADGIIKEYAIWHRSVQKEKRQCFIYFVLLKKKNFYPI